MHTKDSIQLMIFGSGLRECRSVREVGVWPSCAEGSGKLTTSTSFPVSSSVSSLILSITLHLVNLDPGAFCGFCYHCSIPLAFTSKIILSCIDDIVNLKVNLDSLLIQLRAQV